MCSDNEAVGFSALQILPWSDICATFHGRNGVLSRTTAEAMARKPKP